jgi:histidine decarboxylase
MGSCLREIQLGKYAMAVPIEPRHLLADVILRFPDDPFSANRTISMTDLADSPLAAILPRAVQDALFETELRIRQAVTSHLGHPYNLQPAPRAPSTLSALLIGCRCDSSPDPDAWSEVADLERQAIDWLARVWGGSDPGRYRGFVAASGTEGNLRAIHLAREVLPDAILLHGADAHRSIPGAGRMLRVETRAVASLPSGEIDLAALSEALGALNGRPVILVLTCGTSMTGAHDDIAGAITALDEARIAPDRRFVHVDGSLNAMVLPFLPAAPLRIRPDFDMGIDSIVTSGHKMIGTPMPCAALICRTRHCDRIAQALGTVRPEDPMALGSRNGHAVVALWMRLMTHGVAGFSRDALRCTLRAADLAGSLRSIGTKVLLNPWSMTVVFPRPSDAIVRAYQLPCDNGLAHAIVMPSVTDALIERFTTDYLDWFRSTGPEN